MSISRNILFKCLPTSFLDEPTQTSIVITIGNAYCNVINTCGKPNVSHS